MLVPSIASYVLVPSVVFCVPVPSAASHVLVPCVAFGMLVPGGASHMSAHCFDICALVLYIMFRLLVPRSFLGWCISCVGSLCCWCVGSVCYLP